MNTDISSIKELYPFKSNFLKIDGLNYHYVDEGTGTPVLMVHGNPTWSFFYRNLITELCSDYRTVAPDHLGCGLSDKPQKYNYCLENHINNLEKLVLSLDLNNIIMVVHDWGAAIGMGLSIRHPKRIKSLVIMNSSAFTNSNIPFRINILRTPILGKLLIQRLNLFCLAATFMTTEQSLADEIKKGYMLPYNTYEKRIAINKFVQDIPMHPEDASYKLLIEIEHSLWLMRENPVAIIWGMKDWCFTADFLRRWKIYYPQADVLQLDNAGHYVLEDAKQPAIDFLRKFLQKNQL